MTDNLLDQFTKLLNDPKTEEAIIRYLIENSTPEIVEVGKEIFSDSEKKEKFLKTDYKNEFEEIWKKTPKYNKNALFEMEHLINNTSTKEKNMKQFFIRYPWFIDLNYVSIEPQRKLGERNIPDYLLNTDFREAFKSHNLPLLLGL